MPHYRRVGPDTRARWILQPSLNPVVSCFQALMGATLGALLVRQLWRAPLHPSRTAVAAMLCLAAAALLSKAVKRELARVVFPVDVRVPWFQPITVARWAVLTALQAIETAPEPQLYEIRVHLHRVLAPLPVQWAFVSLAASVALLLMLVIRRGDAWLRGRPITIRPERAEVVKAWQLAAAELVLSLMSLPIVAWAAGALDFGTSLGRCAVATSMLIAITFPGPFDPDRATSGSPILDPHGGWLRWYCDRGIGICCTSAVVATVTGIIRPAAGVWLGAAAITILAAFVLAYTLWTAAYRLAISKTVDAILGGASFLDQRFALYLRPFRADFDLGLTPFVADSAVHGEAVDTSRHVFIQLEDALLAALAPIGIPLVAIGQSFTTRIDVATDDEDWWTRFVSLAQRSRFMLCVPGESPGVQDEMGHIRSMGLLAKTLFLMPPSEGRPERVERWQACRRLAGSRGLELPPVHDEGAIFSLRPDGALGLLEPLSDSSALGFRRAILRLLASLPNVPGRDG